jgi:hypothetical protein
MSYSTELQTKLETGIRDLEEDLARLRAALAALDHRPSAPAPTTTATSSASAPRRRSRSRHAGSEVVPAGKIWALLAEAEGRTTAELAQLTNGGHEQILIVLKELEGEGRAHRTGTRRSTRWHASNAPAA